MQPLALSLSNSNQQLRNLAAKANLFLTASKAQATRKAYASDLKDFETFCSANQLPYLAPDGDETIALYVADLAGRAKPSTIARRIATLATAYHALGYRETPASSFLVAEVLRGVRRTLGTAQVHKLPLMPHDLAWMIRACPETVLGVRDRSLLLLGFASGCRRAELRALEIRDLAFSDRGLLISVRQSKTDQELHGRVVPVACGSDLEMCPVRALASWLGVLAAAGIFDGPLLRAVDRHGKISARQLEPGSIARIVKAAARRAGTDSDTIHSLGAHSMRAGMATTAATNGADEREIALVTGHRSGEVRRYIRDANLFRASAAGKLGL